MKMPQRIKKCHFQNEWLTNEEYLNWLQAVPKNRSRVKCSFCKTEIDISNMGVAALDSHTAGKKQNISRLQMQLLLRQCFSRVS